MRALLPLFGMLLLANCASQADAFQQRLTWIKEYEQKHSVLTSGVGRMNRGPNDTLVPQPDCEQAIGQPAIFGAERRLRFHGIENGQICFDQDVTYYPEREAAMAYGGKVTTALERAQQQLPVVEAFTSLSGVPKRPAYVPTAGSPLSLQVISDETRDEKYKDKETGETSYEKIQYAKYRFCGKAPPITPQTRYVTVSHLAPGKDEDGIQLYLWAIVNAPATEHTEPPPLTLDF